MASCACCPALKPRYKRLVDNIFPSAQGDGLVRSEMEKLTYYAVSAPEKLDRIGDYLARRLTRDIARRRKNSVFIAMEALNQLLLACHAQQINLFVESVLKMVAMLLESEIYDYQALGTNSFEKFSQIEEVTASYHRQYDFFVSKFSSMCHSNEKNLTLQQKIQLCGVRGLRGVIRKTVSDELQVNIWEKQHMDKIISSLLYSMQNANDGIVADDRQSLTHEVDQPSALAEESLRELLSRAGFSNVTAAVLPALAHMDNHSLWAPDNSFAIKSFKVIMYSIQGQYSHMVVKLLLDHIDTHSSDDQPIKASMLQVLCTIVPIPATTAIGPSVIDVFNRLSHHLKISAESVHQHIFQNALIETTGILSSVIPDYQKLEAMSFYVNKAVEVVGDNNDIQDVAAVDFKFSNLLLHCLQQISKTYHASSISSVSSTLLEPLIKVTLTHGPQERLFAQNVVMVLLDKNRNHEKLKLVDSPLDIDELGLISSTATKHDAEFLDRQLPRICHWLYESFCLADNNVDNFIGLYKCLSVLSLSVMSPDIIIELSRVVLAAQTSAIEFVTESSHHEAIKHASRVLSVSGACMLLLSHLSAVPEFQHYVNQIILERSSVTPQLLPCSLHNLAKHQSQWPENLIPKVLFSSSQIYDALKGRSGFQVDKLNQPFQPILQKESGISEFRGIDVESINIEFPVTSDPPSSTIPGIKPAEAITYHYFKQLVQQSPVSHKELMDSNQKVVDHILSVPFEQLIDEMPADPCLIARNWVNQVMEAEDLESDDGGIGSLDFPSVCAY